MRDADVLVIGSGAGGLAAAVALARAGKKVHVLEQHYVPGGWCHSFQLGGYRFSPGVHYVGQLEEGAPFRRLLDGLGVSQFLTFFELNPQGYEHCLVGKQRFDFPRGRPHLAERLKARFPREAQGIDRYLTLVERLAAEVSALGEGSGGARDLLALPLRAPRLLRHGLFSMQRALHSRVKDPLLRDILSVQCGDHGLPPSQVPFLLHAAVAGHYLNGAYYPKGGGSALPKAFTRALARAGGALSLRTDVERILLERAPDGRQRAVGVRLTDGTELSARHVVSNADPTVTFSRLVGAEHLSHGLLKKLRGTRYSVSALSLFLAVDCDLRARGLDSGNYWYSDGMPVEALYCAMAQPSVLDRPEPPGFFVSVSTLKDPTHYKGQHTLEMFTFVPHDPFSAYLGLRDSERRPEYRELKRSLTARMIRGLERVIPGVSKHVVFSDLGTPLTNTFYCRATGGNLYGTEKTLGQLGPFGYATRTEISGLYLCGASTLGHGVLGAASSGVTAAANILDCRPSELFRPVLGENLRILSAEEAQQRAPTVRREVPASTEAIV